MIKPTKKSFSNRSADSEILLAGISADPKILDLATSCGSSEYHKFTAKYRQFTARIIPAAKYMDEKLRY